MKKNRKELARITYGELYPLLHLSVLSNWEIIAHIARNGGVATRKQVIEMLVANGVQESTAKGKPWLWKESGLFVSNNGSHGTMQLNTPLLRKLRDKFLELMPNPATKKVENIEPYSAKLSFEIELSKKTLPRKVVLPFTGAKHTVKWAESYNDKGDVTATITCEVLMLNNVIEQVISVNGFF